MTLFFYHLNGEGIFPVSQINCHCAVQIPKLKKMYAFKLFIFVEDFFRNKTHKEDYYSVILFFSSGSALQSSSQAHPEVALEINIGYSLLFK